jgi:hypothetical protein
MSHGLWTSRNPRSWIRCAMRPGASIPCDLVSRFPNTVGSRVNALPNLRVIPGLRAALNLSAAPEARRLRGPNTGPLATLPLPGPLLHLKHPPFDGKQIASFRDHPILRIEHAKVDP